MSQALKSLLVGASLAGGALAGAGATDALAQNISNEVWLGQVGGTNVITIDQAGRNNQAGADNAAYRLNQNGDGNTLGIDQFGYSNRVGTTEWDADLAGRLPTGINQVGSYNSATVRQSNGEWSPGGANTVGAISQRSAYGLYQPTNTLVIEQTGEGEAHHWVGTVRQIYFGQGGVANRAVVVQNDGGAQGEGNSLGDLLQRGSGNRFTLRQAEQSNRVDDVRQLGADNWGWVEQEGGDGNRLEYFQQWGYGNEARVEIDGSDNVVERILQFNTNLGSSASGNIAKVTIHGEDNGAASGGTGEFAADSPARGVGAAQGNIVQIGDANNVRVTIAGQDNMYGTQQLGDGNFAVVSIGVFVDPDTRTITRAGGVANEVAVSQIGDDNVLSHKALGDRNVAAVRQYGVSNWLSIVQISAGGLAGTDRGNLAQVSIRGDRNNNLDAERFFTGVAASAGLQPGTLYQNGLGNTVLASVEGDDNRFAFRQRGNFNSVESIIVGSGNQVAVVQIGNSNTAVTEQYGSGNVAVILQ